jgi:hypothetical protein
VGLSGCGIALGVSSALVSVCVGMCRRNISWSEVREVVLTCCPLNYSSVVLWQDMGLRTR